MSKGENSQFEDRGCVPEVSPSPLKTEKIVRRIVRETGCAELADILAKLPPRDLTSLLYDVYAKQAARQSPLDILNQYTNNVLTNGADADPLKIHQLEGLFYNIVPANYERVDLSILSPLGSNSVLTPVAQRTVFSAVRNIEVLADISVALSIEAARRRKVLMRFPQSACASVSLASCQRVARLRQRPTEKGYNAHWKMVGLATAGKNGKSGNNDLELAVMPEHVGVYLKLFESARDLNSLTVSFSDVTIMESLIRSRGLDRAGVLHAGNNGQAVNFATLGIPLPGRSREVNGSLCRRMKDLGLEEQAYRLSAMMPFIERLQKASSANFEFKLDRTAGMGYYKNLCFHFEARNNMGESLIMVDGGNADWTQKMLSDQREIVFVSGMGSELFIRKFGLVEMN